MSRRSICAIACSATLVCLCAPRTVCAEPLRLRGDALLETRSPVGLLVLQGEDRFKPWLDAEALAWVGVTNQPTAGADVLTASVRVRREWGEARLGRMLVSMGAIRPIHIDGARALARLPFGTTFEAFGGFPVVPRFDYRGTFDWAVGGRIAQQASWVTIGGSYLQRRTERLPSTEEAGADIAITPNKTFTAAGRIAFDLLAPGVTDALVSSSIQSKTMRLEVFGTHRSPGRMLPKTSLFSVLGDFAATSGGATGRWRAAPRLELLATGSVQASGDVVGGQGLARATLAFDDEWSGTIGAEVRRVWFGTSRWIGGRVILGVPLPLRLRFGTELEIVRPDDASRGSVWPWLLGSLAYRSTGGWDVAAAIEASAGPEYRSEVNALARFSWATK